MSREEDNQILASCLPPGAERRVADEGFRRLYDAYAPRVRTILFRYCGASDVHDLVQETFVKIWTGLPSFKRECALNTWIYRVAVNVAKDHQRAHGRRRWLLFLGDQLSAIEPRDSRDQERQLHDREDLARAISALSPKLKEVIVLFSLEELEIEHISAVLDLPVGTVKSRLHMARRLLRGHLEDARPVYG